MSVTTEQILSAPDPLTAVDNAVAAIKRLGQLGAEDATVAEAFAAAAQANATDEDFETGFEIINS